MGLLFWEWWSEMKCTSRYKAAEFEFAGDVYTSPANIEFGPISVHYMCSVSFLCWWKYQNSLWCRTFESNFFVLEIEMMWSFPWLQTVHRHKTITLCMLWSVYWFNLISCLLRVIPIVINLCLLQLAISSFLKIFFYIHSLLLAIFVSIHWSTLVQEGWISKLSERGGLIIFGPPIL